MRKFLLLFVILCCVNRSFAQDFSNKGKEFWIAYSYHVGMVSGANPTMTLNITSDVNTTFSVEIYGVGVLASGNITANTVTNVSIPAAYFASVDGLINNRAIHVTAAKPIVVYSFITRSQASAATLCLPTTVLGKQYYSMSFDQISNEASSCSYITIIGVEDNTTVEIIPTGSTRGGWAAGSINTITLNKGQIYQVLGNTSGNTGEDLSGTSVRSIASGTGACKKIAVFSGSGKVLISRPGDGCDNGADNLYQQLYPIVSWGKKYLTVPSANNRNNYYRIIKSTPTVNVTVNGAAVPAGSFVNGYYTFLNNRQNIIQADQPICVAQFFTSQNCAGNGSPYDPDMIILNPVEQNISNVTLISTNKLSAAVTTPVHHVHVIMPNTGTAISSFKFDGTTPPASAWTPHPQAPGFSYIYFSNISQTSHTLSSDSGFNALAYGYSDFESYGYSAGTNVKDLYQQIGVKSLYGIETTPSVCTGSPFKFKISLPYQPDSMYWNLAPTHPGAWIKPVLPATTLVFDSTTTINGKQVWWYSLPLFYTYNAIGEYPITITTYNSNSDGCGSEQEIDFELEVSDPPAAGFTWVAPRCVADSVQFNDASTTVKPTYHWWWSFGDPASGALNNTSALKNPKHLFSSPGTYTVRYSNITTPGCLSDTITRSVVIAAMPTAAMTGNISVCQGAPAPNITFTGAGGSAPYTFSYRINGGTPQTVTTTTGNLATVPVPTTTANTFIYTLTNAENTGSLTCTQAQTGTVTVLVRPLPSATIAGTTTVCQTGTSPNITFTGSGATAPYTFTYTINGGTPQTVTGNSVTVPAPTNVVGVSTYALTGVKDGSSNACTNTVTAATAIVTIRELPTASISGTTAACQNGTAPSITFAGNGGVPPYTFTYNINGGTPQTITSVGSTAILPAPATALGTFIYTLTSVKDGSPNICTNAVAGASATVNIRPLPTATINGTTSVCQNDATPFVTFTGAGTTAPYTFTYTINGGAPQTVTSTTGNSATVAVPTVTAGTFVYALTLVKDATTTLCSSPVTGAGATVIVRPLPTASISGTATVCLNSAPPMITFTGATGTAPYTFAYTVGGDPALIITTTGNSVSIPVPTNVAGTFTYTILSVRDGSSNHCVRNLAGVAATVTVKGLPTATIAASKTELCLNTTAPNITFTGANGAAPYRFTYKINGGADQFITTTATSSSVTAAVPTNLAGTFNYTLVNVREGSASLCERAITGSASVLVDPLPTAAFTYSVPSCQTRTIAFNSSTSLANAGTITTWQWNFGDAASGATNNTSALPNPEHVFSAAGNYTITLKVTTDKGCVSIPLSKTVTINPRPKAGFVVPEVCLTDPFAQFTDTSKIAAPGSITAWEWTFGDATNSTGANPNTSTQQNARHKYTVVGDYIVRLVAISNNGCRDTLMQNLTINGGNPVADFLPATTGKYCGNDTISIQNKSTIASGKITRIEIFWDNVNAPTVFETDERATPDTIYKHKYPDFQSPLVKNYSIRVRAYSGGICFSDKIRVVAINASPKVAFAELPNGCIDVPPYRITQATETGGIPGIGVYSGAGVIMVSPGVYNFSPAAAGQGTHSIKYIFTSTAGGCVDSASRQVTVYPNPVVDAGPDLTILQGGSTTIQPTVTGNDLQYLWTENRYLNNNTIRTPLASPPADKTYTLTVTARGGCTAADQVFIKVLMAPKIPNTFTPNSDGKNDFWKIEYLDTYPNCKVKIFTRTGTQVFESRGYKTPWNGTMNGKPLPVDTYYYIIEPESGRTPITGYVQIIK